VSENEKEAALTRQDLSDTTDRRSERVVAQLESNLKRREMLRERLKALELKTWTRACLMKYLLKRIEAS
jgi:hypothetical protein